MTFIASGGSWLNTNRAFSPHAGRKCSLTCFCIAFTIRSTWRFVATSDSLMTAIRGLLRSSFSNIAPPPQRMSDSKHNFKTQQHRARTLCAARDQEIRIIAIDELGTETEYRVIEYIEEVYRGAKPEAIAHLKCSRRPQVDCASAGPHTVVAWQIAARADRREDQCRLYIIGRRAAGPSPFRPSYASYEARAVVFD